MSDAHGTDHAPVSSDPPAAAEPRTSLRDNLESIGLAIVLVLIVRQTVVEAFKIPTGSMAPTLLGIHKEVRCPNCLWVFRVGHDKLGAGGEVRCPNCLYRWRGAWDYYPGPYGPEPIKFRSPAWLWHECWTDSGWRASGTEAANRVNRWGTRIFVNKFIYKLRKPRRWEIAVFLYPFAHAVCRECGWEGEVQAGRPEHCPACGSEELTVTRKNYVKRLVGMPGERIALANGDMYVNGRIARKPPGVQRSVWMHVFDSAFVPREKVAPAWDFGGYETLWEQHAGDGSLTLNALEAREPVCAAFARPIRDFYAYNARQGGFEGLPGSHDVGDCRLEVALTVESCRAEANTGVELRIAEDEHEFRLFVPAGRDAEAVLWDGAVEVARRAVRGLQPGEKVRVALENYDDMVVANLRGRDLLSFSYDGNPASSQRRKRVAFGAAGARVVFNRVGIQRDLYYTDSNLSAASPLVYELDASSYFLLGDNSPESSDSRAWPSPGVPRDYLMGEAFAIFWPIHDIQLLSTGPR